MPHSLFLRTAIEAARAGEDIIRHYYQRNIGVRLKADRSPVTVADIETEQAIQRILQAAFPGHGFYGEETGKDSADAEFTWLVDPIDGTKSFVRGIPFFSTQIALMKGDELVLGVSNAPMFQELACAEVAGGAFINDDPVRVSDVTQLADATLSFGNIKTLAGGRRWTELADLIRRADRVRGYGDFYHYHLLAAGKLDIVVESDIHILDIAALSVIIGEAGGRVTDLEGRRVGLDSTSILTAATGPLHGQVLAALA